MPDILKTNPLITAVRRLELTPEIEEQLGDRALEVKERLETVAVYAITYLSQNHKVNGYFAQPITRESLPCVIVNRGGSKEFSTWTDATALRTLSLYASWGYLVAASQYSGCAGSEGKDEMGGSELDDILVLRELFAHHQQANVEQIGMVGASRGGMMTYLSLAKVNWLKAAISVAGISDLARGYKLRPSLAEFHGDMYDTTNSEELEKRSAICWPERFSKTTPLLMMHGTADGRVSALDSIELAAKLYENKVPFRLSIFDGANHYLAPYQKGRMEMTKRWLDRFVRDQEPVPDLTLDLD